MARKSPHSGSLDDMPLWARGLAIEMRRFIHEARQDRKQATEDRKQAAEDRRQAAEDRRQATRDRRQFLLVVREITQVGRAFQQEQKKQTQILLDIRQAVRIQGNGSGGNGK